jgi:precorrin-6Y C5,15-methyltransferase (decarboxylating)
MCLYSGATQLVDKLGDLPYEVKVYQGVSSVAYLASKLNLNWADARVVSMHGEDNDIVKLVSENKSLYVLTGSNVKEICKSLSKAGLNDVKVCIGERLSYLDERVLWGYPKDFLKREFNSISTMYIENDNYGKPLMNILEDEELERVKGIPMTKRDIRAAVIERMRLSTNSVIYDIGAGTGGISVELARRAVNGKVYALESNPEAVALINRNKEKHKLNNLIVTEGNALDTINTLPKPDIVFIGGSGGALRAILSLLTARKDDMRIVLTAIVLETAFEAMRFFKENSFKNIELTQLSVTLGKNIGERTMLVGENPVFIISADFKPSVK